MKNPSFARVHISRKGLRKRGGRTNATHLVGDGDGADLLEKLQGAHDVRLATTIDENDALLAFWVVEDRLVDTDLGDEITLTDILERSFCGNPILVPLDNDLPRHRASVAQYFGEFSRVDAFEPDDPLFLEPL